MNLSDLKNYSFKLPACLIASHPSEQRDRSRLMKLTDRGITHHIFNELPGLLREGDLLVANNTRVEARRIFLRRAQTARGQGARIEAVFLERDTDKESRRETEGELWRALLKKRKRLRDGELLYAEKNRDFTFTVIRDENNRVWLRPVQKLSEEIFSELGQMPVPPYFNREEEPEDRSRYQSVFAEKPGSAAAPTAALHFTRQLISDLESKGIDLQFLTMHIGYGTFAPLKDENFEKESLHAEQYSVSEKLAERLRKRDYNRLIAVGTTSLRVLETVYRRSGGRFDESLNSETDLFIHPPDRIHSVDGLITNFHLPESSLLLLVASLISREQLLAAYKTAVKHEYRFFSYGDAMLII